MDNKFEIIYRNEEGLYVENAPIIIKTRAIVKNIQTGDKHVQLKFKNITEKNIAVLKVKLFMCDIAGREVETIEKTYFDFNVKQNEEFGANVAIPIREKMACNLNALVEEVCFIDGTIWTNKNSSWEQIPTQRLLSDVYGEDLFLGLQGAYGSNIKYEVIEYKDIWICSCGCVNKQENQHCKCCDMNKDEFNNLNKGVLILNGSYARAINLINSSSSSKIEEGIQILESILYQKNCLVELENAKARYEEVIREEQNFEKLQKKKKKTIISAVSISLAILIVFTIIISVVNAKKQAPFVKLRDFVSEEGVYLEDEQSFGIIIVEYDSIDAAIFYNTTTENIELVLYYEGDYLSVLKIYINKKTLQKKEYTWRYLDEVGNDVEGEVIAKDFDSESAYEITKGTNNSAVISLVKAMTIIFFACYLNTTYDIGVEPIDLGFDVEKNSGTAV